MFKRGAKRTRGGQAWDVSQMFKRYKAARGAEGAGIVFPGVAQRARLRKRNMRTAGFLGIETKFYDTGIAGTAIVATAAGAEMDPTPNVLCLNAITQGDGESQRDGRKVVIKSLQIKGMINADTVANSADPPAGRLIRILVVQDKQTNGATGLQLFSGSSPTTLELSNALLDNRSGMVSINAPYNQNTKERFKILYDRTFNINPNDKAGSLDYVVNVRKMINLNNAVVMYSEGTSTIDALPSRNLFVAYYYSLSTDPSIQMNFTSRFFYTDE